MYIIWLLWLFVSINTLSQLSFDVCWPPHDGIPMMAFRQGSLWSLRVWNSLLAMWHLGCQGALRHSHGNPTRVGSSSTPTVVGKFKFYHWAIFFFLLSQMTERDILGWKCLEFPIGCFWSEAKWVSISRLLRFAAVFCSDRSNWTLNLVRSRRADGVMCKYSNPQWLMILFPHVFIVPCVSL